MLGANNARSRDYDVSLERRFEGGIRVDISHMRREVIPARRKSREAKALLIRGWEGRLREATDAMECRNVLMMTSNEMQALCSERWIRVANNL